MGWLEVVILILLVIIIMHKIERGRPRGVPRRWRGSGGGRDKPVVIVCPPTKDDVIDHHVEHEIEACGDPDEGTDFYEWVREHTIDKNTVASHRQFVDERVAATNSGTGSTMGTSEHEVYDQVPWRGLSRPTRVAVTAPDQVTEIDPESLPERQRVRFSI